MRTPAGASAEARARALTSASAFAGAVASGVPGELAKTHGLTPMPPFDVSAEGVEPQLAATAFRLKPGQWSQALATRAGWAVIRVVEVHAGQPRPPADVRERVRRMLANQREIAERERLMSELRSEAEVVVLRW